MTRIFDTPGPRWFSIPAHRPFVEDLAAGLHARLSPLGPEALSQAVVLTPTRRGARALAEAFVSVAGGKALLLPQIRALGDLDEGEPPFEPGELALDLPPAVSSWRRRFELARIAADQAHLLERELDASGALEMADALAGFLDSAQIEEIAGRGRLESLVDGDLAKHWQVSARFLTAALDAWSDRLRALDLIDVSERRVRLLRALGDLWKAQPPQGVMIAAGSTGTAPATADLLGVIAGLPQGAVVLPGLDEGLAETAWLQINAGEQHPQGAMKRLLERHRVGREAVTPWIVDADMKGRWRRRLVNEALRPAEATADWLAQIARLRAEAPEGVDPFAEGLKGLSVAAARTEEEAALVCALLLREALETPGVTCALVTPDRELSRRVGARLARWGVAADDSAGADLAGYAVAVLADHVAALSADPLDPVRLLAVVKHPLVRLGLEEVDLNIARGLLEARGLRGPRPPSRERLFAKLAKHPEAADLARRLFAALDIAAQPFAAGPASPPDAAAALARSMEALADGPDGYGALWNGAGGEGLGSLLAALSGEGDGLPAATAAGFHDLLGRLIGGESVRTGGATHPRLRILGAIEARLVRADRLILAGLEEGVWPKAPPTDPFLSRPMRTALGLPPPERRVGLSAHDFAQAASAPEVVLVHSERRGGAPAVESRWLWRLRTLARGAGAALPERHDVLEWARAIDAPATYDPVRRPAPRPPVEHRPTQMPVTRIEALTRDPYAVWARAILNLKRLDRPDEPVDVRARGTAIHRAFEQLALRHPHPGPLPADLADIFRDLYLDALRDEGMPDAALVREAALATEAAAWVADLEARRREHSARIIVEQSGAVTFSSALGDFTLTAKTDRIEVTADGMGHILDYKTGAAPTAKMVEAGFSPQLTLTAAILLRGGFEGIGKVAPGDLTYVRVTGRKPAGQEVTIAAAGGESLKAAEQAFEGLRRLIDRYADPEQPYLSRVAPQFVKDHAGDYAHLARVFEWSTAGEDGGDE
ncbi:double-strand break repair protein AddB [Caulobacter segnis]|uniref:double-strand break repair protein AddB n=1 Tax=Caulobacter segnis TaxID=88688 RepID=UPI00240F4B89|nr:double-strand break repair protein AddB [Caulobacter segnis]MDG2521374.1 double-strand break repair protein AddB [Caulobacter segnis]